MNKRIITVLFVFALFMSCMCLLAYLLAEYSYFPAVKAEIMATRTAEAATEVMPTVTPEPTSSPTQEATVIPESETLPTECGYSTIAAQRSLENTQFQNYGIGTNTLWDSGSCASHIILWPQGSNYDNSQFTHEMFGFAANGTWYFTTPTEKVLRWDDMLVFLQARIQDENAELSWYDLISQEKIILSFNKNDLSGLNWNRQIIDPKDITSEIAPDNECNWPHWVELGTIWAQTHPDNQTFWGHWVMTEGCNRGINIVLTDENHIIYVMKDGNLYQGYLNNGNSEIFTYSMEENVVSLVDSQGLFIDMSLNPDGTSEVITQQGNSDLLWTAARVIGNQQDDYLAQWNQTVALYQKAISTPMGQARNFNNLGWVEIEENGHSVSIYTFISEGKHRTGLFFYQDGQVFGPVIIDNIREFQWWKVVDQNIVGSYNDGTATIFTLNTDGTVQMTTE